MAVGDTIYRAYGLGLLRADPSSGCWHGGGGGGGVLVAAVAMEGRLLVHKDEVVESTTSRPLHTAGM